MSDGTADEPDERAIEERRAELVAIALHDATERPKLLRGGRAPVPLPCLSVSPPDPPPRRSPWSFVAVVVLAFLIAGFAGYLAFRRAR